MKHTIRRAEIYARSEVEASSIIILTDPSGVIIEIARDPRLTE
jgi:hypothetical protein